MDLMSVRDEQQTNEIHLVDKRDIACQQSSVVRAAELGK